MEQVALIPEQGTAHAAEVDRLFLFIFAVSAFITLLIAGLLIFFALRYRRRSEDFIPEPIVGSIRLEVTWMVVPLLIALVMFVWGASAYFKMVRPPDDAAEVYVVARQWMWKVQHPGGQREINVLHVPVGQPVKLVMTSEDVIHSFYVPDFRVKQDVLPGRYTYLWFTASRPGEFKLFCAEYCGTGHSLMRGTVVALEPEEYRRWLAENAEGSMALEGRKLFQRFQCVECHTGRGGSKAPSLEAVYRTWVELQDGRKVFADEEYLRRSILKPEADVVAGYQPIMPTFQGQMSEEELQRLVAFIKALAPGETPPRVEEAEPPRAKVPEAKPKP